MKQHKIKGKTLRFHTLPRGLKKKKKSTSREEEQLHKWKAKKLKHNSVHFYH